MTTGVIVPLVTPVDGTGTVSEADVARLCGRLGGVAGLLPVLSTGEGWALDENQWRDMVAHTVRYAAGLPVFAGILRPTTAEVGHRVVAAAGLGVRAVVVSTPFGPTVSQERMRLHYTEIAELAARSGVELVVYNESAVSGNTMALPTLLAVCGLPGVVAVKESSGAVALTRRLVAAAPRVPVWQGFEHLVGACDGIDGAVLALANLEPELCVAATRTPTPDLVAALSSACAEYGLFESDWYRAVKARLRELGVITNAGLVEQGGGRWTREPATVR